MGLAVKRITSQELNRIKTHELGLDPERYSMQSSEGLACSLRRAAGYMSPCSAATLIRAVTTPLEGLANELDALREKVEEVLEALIAHGDLIEQKDITSGDGAALIYAAPPSFVVRKSGSVILLGIVPDLRTPLPSELEARIQYIGHVRRILAASGESLKDVLQEIGTIELTEDYWLRAPIVIPAQKHVAAANEMLSKAPGFSSEIPGLSILDGEQPVRYYRGRWSAPKKHTGRYIARRKQLYGADLWCYVELVNGNAQRLCDLPFQVSRHRGCDAAWHLQMALDANNERPQEFSVVDETSGQKIFKFFSPIPQWAQRRLSAVGTPVNMKGCLFAYRVSAEEIEEERKYLLESLWLKESK